MITTNSLASAAIMGLLHSAMTEYLIMPQVLAIRKVVVMLHGVTKPLASREKTQKCREEGKDQRPVI